MLLTYCPISANNEQLDDYLYFSLHVGMLWIKIQKAPGVLQNASELKLLSMEDTLYDDPTDWGPVEVGLFLDLRNTY